MTSTAAPLVPPDADLEAVREAAAGCKACELHKSGTQTVFGDGPSHARVVLVGEQPGEREDQQGAPFVGPAGRVLDEALESAGIDRAQAYVTNIVKHFKWRPRGKRRIHQRPNAEEITACRPWFDAELARLRPEVVVPLGATAAQALLGASLRITRQRGEVLEWRGTSPVTDVPPRLVPTVHPSSVIRLRGSDEQGYREAMAGLVDDLRVVRGLLAD